jgi:hypothetical protein
VSGFSVEELRPLFDNLDREQTAARTALDANDMQAWAEHAARGAEIHEEIARRAGWREDR